jgi:hypothetical protein
MALGRNGGPGLSAAAGDGWSPARVVRGGSLAAMLRRLPALAGLAVLAGASASSPGTGRLHGLSSEMSRR